MSDEQTVRKMSGLTFVTAEQLAEAQPLADALAARITEWSDPNYIPPKPWEGEPLTPKPAAYQEMLDEFPAARSTAESALYELIELHGPKPYSVRPDGSVWHWQCEGCEVGGAEWEYPYWPCETTAVIARHLGVSVEAM